MSRILRTIREAWCVAMGGHAFRNEEGTLIWRQTHADFYDDLTVHHRTERQAFQVRVCHHCRALELPKAPIVFDWIFLQLRRQRRYVHFARENVRVSGIYLMHPDERLPIPQERRPYTGLKLECSGADVRLLEVEDMDRSLGHRYA